MSTSSNSAWNSATVRLSRTHSPSCGNSFGQQPLPLHLPPDFYRVWPWPLYISARPATRACVIHTFTIITFPLKCPPFCHVTSPVWLSGLYAAPQQFTSGQKQCLCPVWIFLILLGPWLTFALWGMWRAGTQSEEPLLKVTGRSKQRSMGEPWKPGG